MLSLLIDNTCSKTEIEKYECSPLSILILSGAPVNLKSIIINEVSESYSVRLLIKLDNDYRWHWVSDIIDSISVVKHFIISIINNIKEKNTIKNFEYLNMWRDEIFSFNFNLKHLYLTNEQVE